jgi:phage terminase Nu1 subunit (DNA packaging protein)
MTKKKVAKPALKEKAVKSPSLSEQVRNRELKNIFDKLKAGKTLNAREAQLVDKYESDQEREKSKDRQSGNLFDESLESTTVMLVEFCGITAARVGQLANEGVFVKSKRGKYLAAVSIKNYIRALQKMRRSRHGTDSTLEELRQRLLEEQGRKEAALASLRELELEQKQSSMIPESDAIEVVLGLLTPLRRLLDAMPRQVSSQANPAEPAIAELAIRNFMDDRIFTACQKICEDIETQLEKKHG